MPAEGSEIYVKQKRPAFSPKAELRPVNFVFTVFILLSFAYINKKSRNYPFKDNSDPVTQTNAL